MTILRDGCETVTIWQRLQELLKTARGFLKQALPLRSAISAYRSPHNPFWQDRVTSPGSSRLTTDASIAAWPEIDILIYSARSAVSTIIS